MKNSLSAIVIARNEEQNIGRIVGGLLQQYDGELLELIVVDDASTDQTVFLAQVWAKKDARIKIVRRVSPWGAGRALKTGFAHVDPRADFVLIMDSDFVENIGEIRRLIKAVDQDGYDGVIGSRFIKGSRMELYPWPKRIMNRLFHLIVKALFRIKQNDLTNNFKLYKADIFRKLPWRSSYFSLNAETGLLPILRGYKIGEVPVSWVGRQRGMGRSKFSLIRFGWGYIGVIFYAWQFRRKI